MEWWYLDEDAEKQGPFTLGELARYYAQGGLTRERYVWAEEAGSEWCKIEACLGGRLLDQLREEIEQLRAALASKL